VIDDEIVENENEEKPVIPIQEVKETTLDAKIEKTKKPKKGTFYFYS
jgi:hypothetical protein